MATVFGSDPLEELVIPDGTHVKEHDLEIGRASCRERV